MSSPEWKNRRVRLINKTFNLDENKSNGFEDRRYECQRCHWNFCRDELEVHHLTYERLGNEKDGDLVVVCKRCHGILDNIRANESEQRRQNALYEAQLDGWASKKYGEYWHEDNDWYDIAQEFDEWLERKGDW